MATDTRTVMSAWFWRRVPASAWRAGGAACVVGAAAARAAASNRRPSVRRGWRMRLCRPISPCAGARAVRREHLSIAMHSIRCGTGNGTRVMRDGARRAGAHLPIRGSPAQGRRSGCSAESLDSPVGTPRRDRERFLRTLIGAALAWLGACLFPFGRLYDRARAYPVGLGRRERPPVGWIARRRRRR